MEPVSAGTGSRDMEPVLKYDSHIGDGPCKFMIRIGQSERLCCFQLNLERKWRFKLCIYPKIPYND